MNMIVGRFKSVLLVSCIWLVGAGAAFPQAAASLGTIEGTVDDTTGGVLPGATVTITNVGTGITRTVVTDAGGHFNAPLLPLGSYTLRVELSGFRTLIRDGLVLSIGSTVTLSDLTIDVATVEEVVTVTADSPVVETARAVQSATFEEKAISDLPINGRDFQDFATLTPTVIRERDRDTISMGGQKGIDTNISLDGGDFNNAFFGQAQGQPETNFVIAQEAVKEFQVLANGFSAEFGRSAGGALNVVTKSGTNTMQGSAFGFFRTEGLKSTLDDADGDPITNNDFSQQFYGGSFGGPIIRDKAHYFVAVEQQFFATPFTVRLDRDVTGICNSDIHGQSISGVDCLSDLEGAFDSSTDITAILGKVDFQMSENNSLSVRYNLSYFKGSNFGASTISSNAAGQTEDTSDTTHTISVANTTLIGTNKFNELRFQYSFEDRPRLGATNEVPEVNIGDVGDFGRTGFLPITSEHTRLQITDNFTYLFGTHDLKVGGDINLTNTKQAFIGFSGGQWDFNTLEDYIASNPNRFRQLVGLNGFTTLQSGSVDFGQNEYALYVQDTWRPKPGLTVNAGLRWEGLDNPTVPTEQFGNPTRNPKEPGDIFGLDQQEVVDDWNQWAPRFGIAWDPNNDGRTVIRGGAGIFYSRTPLLLIANILTNNGFRQGTVDLRSGFDVLPFTFPGIFPEVGLPPDDPLSAQLEAIPVDVFFWDPDFRNPRITRFNVGVEREVVQNLSVGVDVVYADSDRGQRRIDLNITDTGQTDGLGRALFDSRNRPDPRFRRLALNQSNANGRYYAFVFSARKRLSGGSLFQAYYTYSDNVSEDDNERSATGIGPSQPESFGVDRGPSDRDVRHRFVGSVVWALPADVQLSSTIIMNTGDPYNITSGFDDNGDGLRNDRPVIDSSNRPSGLDTPDGLQPRNSARQPTFYNVDIRLSKAFDFGSAGSLELLLDVFNLFNSANRRTTNTNFSRSTFTALNRVGDSRQAQFGIRYRF